MWLRYNILTLSGKVKYAGIVNTNNILSVVTSSDGTNLYAKVTEDEYPTMVLVDYKSNDLDKLCRILNKE